MTSLSTTNGHTNGSAPASEEHGPYDVCVVGAGPAGLMLSVIAAKLGLKVKVADERPDQTTVGRADGIQPKTIETFQMLRIGDELMKTGVRVHDICLWRGSQKEGIRRTGREVHYPASVVDVLEPYILLCHQGMMESTFIDDLRKSGVEVSRSHKFTGFTSRSEDPSSPLLINCDLPDAQTTIQARYLVGSDGARSQVRNCIPNANGQGSPHNSVWGVLDGELDTDFPDIWSKTVVFSEEHGSVLIIPRERNMTRLYIEMKSSITSKGLAQDYVMEQARLVMAPYRVEWVSVEWFGNYAVSQRVASKFLDPTARAFIAGDASHTHSPKAAQGMNTSVHDSWNLGWKLNLAARGFAKDGILLQSYEQERKKIAHDLINFDFEHANEIAGGDAKRLAENFRKNTRFISGIGVEYGPNELNQGVEEAHGGNAKPGCNLPPAKVTRYIDACPVDIQLDIPILGQFRLYFAVPNVTGSGEKSFLENFDQAASAPSTFLSQLSKAAEASYKAKPRAKRADDAYLRPERYTTVSQLFTYGLITSTDKNEFEIAELPEAFSKSKWTVYLDDVSYLDRRGVSCSEKWLGSVSPGEVAVIVVRPDGYVGALRRFKGAGDEDGKAAAQWLDSYFQGFLHVPQSL
ncbi:FAD binding domain-containing protein [Fusarium solani]|uniref:FAD binding domain-containing protein n=1 Tax=Fusarium solani TaxID=169388 RepID=A0A9P9K0Y1_FUSSL|nr:FAD binding domain-containing protein [Fusarium solani]KAH7239865.1 FAD binding domain-containing protein [Fusarium solani]